MQSSHNHETLSMMSATTKNSKEVTEHSSEENECELDKIIEEPVLKSKCWTDQVEEDEENDFEQMITMGRFMRGK